MDGILDSCTSGALRHDSVINCRIESSHHQISREKQMLIYSFLLFVEDLFFKCYCGVKHLGTICWRCIQFVQILFLFTFAWIHGVVANVFAQRNIVPISCLSKPIIPVIPSVLSLVRVKEHLRQVPFLENKIQAPTLWFILKIKKIIVQHKNPMNLYKRDADLVYGLLFLTEAFSYAWISY